jgi:hypothetical protein
MPPPLSLTTTRGTGDPEPNPSQRRAIATFWRAIEPGDAREGEPEGEVYHDAIEPPVSDPQTLIEAGVPQNSQTTAPNQLPSSTQQLSIAMNLAEEAGTLPASTETASPKRRTRAQTELWNSIRTDLVFLLLKTHHQLIQINTSSEISSNLKQLIWVEFEDPQTRRLLDD